MVVHGDDGMDQSAAVEYDRSVSSKYASTNSRAGKAGDLLYSSSSAARQGLNPVPGECRQTDAAASERSIYDNTPEHCYANVEKDESGRLLNRDTLAFRVSDYENEKSAAPLTQANGQAGAAHLVDTSALRADRFCDVPVVIHRTNKSAENVCTNNFSHGLTVDVTQSDITEQVPYHTGRSVFYQRVDSTEGTGVCIHFCTAVLAFVCIDF